MKTTYKLMVFLFAVCGTAMGQVAPAATAPGGSTLQYAMRFAEAGQYNQSFPTTQAATASGSLTYLNGSERYPFSVDYGGGYTWILTGTGSQSGQSQRLFLTQGLGWRKTKFTVNDDLRYLTQAPTTGFLGIPGIGEPIGVTTPTSPSSQSILTLNTHVIENSASGSLEHSLNAATMVSVGGNSALLRYPNGDGLDTDNLSATGIFVRNLDGRNALVGEYLYSNYSYPGYVFNFATHNGLFGYRRKWTRNLTSDISAGPEWIVSSLPTVVPNARLLTVNAGFDYTLRFTSASARYTRGTNGGSGYLFGGESDSVSGNFSRQFGMNLTVGLTGGYQRTAGLNNNGTTNSMFGGAQGTYRIGRTMIAFANYTGSNQSTTSALPNNVLNQVTQTIGFGFGYSPRPKRVRQ